MDSNIQGPIEAISTASIKSQRGYQIDFSDVFPKTLCKIKASSDRPIFLELQAALLVAFNAGTTNEITVSTDQLLTLIGNISIDESVAAVQAYTPVLIREDTEIIVNYSHTGTAPTTGKAIIIVGAAGLGVGGELNLK